MPDKQQRNVHIVYRRQVSDGNYGTESAEVSLDWFVDNDENTTEDIAAAEEMLAQARDLVLAHLRGSLSENVKRAVSPHPATALTARAEMARAAAAATAADPDEDF